MKLKGVKQTETRPVPRVPSDGSLEGLLLVLTIVWIFGSLLAFFFAIVTVAPGWYRFWRLSQNGEITTGQLIRQDQGASWYAYLYRFSAQPEPDRAAKIFLGQQSVGSDHSEPLVVSTPVPIRYLISNPQISVIEQYFGPPPIAPILFFGLATISLCGGLALLPGCWQKWRILHHLQTQGKKITAKIIYRWRTVDENNNDLYCVAYRFTVTFPANPGAQTVVMAEINRLAYLTLEIGDTSPVKYLPGQPEVCCLDMNPLLRKNQSGA
jgi:hypothetical protein